MLIFFSLRIHTYMYVCIHIYTHTHTHTYIPPQQEEKKLNEVKQLQLVADKRGSINY